MAALDLRDPTRRRLEVGEFNPSPTPVLSDTAVNTRARLWKAESLVELQDVLPQRIVHVVELVVGQLVKQLAISVISQRVLTAHGRFAGVEVYIWRLQIVVLNFGQRLAEMINCLVHALEIEILGLGRWLLEIDVT